MSRFLKNIINDSNTNMVGKLGKHAGKKKSLVKASFSGVTAKGISFKFNTDSQRMKPLNLLKELHSLCSDESLTKDEKNIEIRKMLEREQ